MHIFERIVKVGNKDNEKIDFESIFDSAVSEYNERNGITTPPKASKPEDKKKTKKEQLSKPEKKELTINKQPKGEKIKRYLRKREEEKWDKAHVTSSNDRIPLGDGIKRDVAFGLAMIGIASLIGIGTLFGMKKLYNYGYQKGTEWGEEFWGETKKNMEERRKAYKSLYGDPDEKKSQNPSSNEEVESEK